MTTFKPGEKIQVAVHKSADGLSRLRIDPRSPKDELASSNYWIDTIISDDPSQSHYDPSDNTYLVVGVPGLFHGLTFWAREEYIRRPCRGIDGINCDNCGEFYPMAEPNFEVSKLICFSCVDSNGWKYQKDKVTKIVTLKK